MGIKVTESVACFLKAKTVPDLAAMYSDEMEVQINVAQDDGEPIDGRAGCYTNKVQEWYPIRIPRKAATEPEDNDHDIRWDIAAHAQGIGMTGWNWKRKKTYWLAFDFDSISNHVRKGLTDAEISQVKEAAKKIPWVTVRKSTSGRGLHLYVMLAEQTPSGWVGGYDTNNHSEHAALARSVLGLMAATVDFDFSGKIDVCGGNMWVWHRKQVGTDGLTLVKKGEVLNSALIPVNWRDHVPVIRGERKRPKLADVPDDCNNIEELTGTHLRIALSDVHKKLVSFLQESGAMHWWDADRHLLVAHTADLKEAHKKLSLRGIFDTLATGKDKGADQNCFMFPLENGGWVVRRHTPGVNEHPCWEQDGRGWTRCFYNVETSFETAARANNGVEHSKGGYVFMGVQEATNALKNLGVSLDLPADINNRREVIVRERKDGKLVVQFTRDNSDSTLNMNGWISEGTKWSKVVTAKSISTANLDTSGDTLGDAIIRHLVDTDHRDAGWCIRNQMGLWQFESLTNLQLALKSLGFNNADASKALGSNVLRAWRLVNRPFEPEYPGNREWNKDAAQFRFAPALNRENLQFSTWTRIFKHLGANLDQYMQEDEWCVANGIKTGGDYLLYWTASMFQRPTMPLPYLFLWSEEQRTGKSMFHESLSLLMTRGYTDAGNALSNQQGFNGELLGAVLCPIEEKDLTNKSTAYTRIKHWVTAVQLPIHPKNGTPFMVPNTTHWVHCANSKDATPIFPGDTRITMIHVGQINILEMIPKFEMIRMLEDEAPAFLRFILDLELPKAPDRLGLPVITTDEKRLASARNQNLVLAFVEENLYNAPGHTLLYGDVYDRFVASLEDDAQKYEWTKPKFTRDLPLWCVHGRLTNDPRKHIGNVAWKFDASGKEQPKPENKPPYASLLGVLRQGAG